MLCLEFFLALSGPTVLKIVRFNEHVRAQSAGLQDAVHHLGSVVALCKVIEGAHIAVGLILKLIDERLQAADLHSIPYIQSVARKRES